MSPTFGLIDHVYTERLENLRLGEMSDPNLCENRNRHRRHDFFDQLKNEEKLIFVF